jgi:hypothetical protein
MAASGLRKGGRASTDIFIVLHDLLEGYAPVWYTEKHHKRAELVMRHLKAMDPRPAKKRLSN